MCEKLEYKKYENEKNENYDLTSLLNLYSSALTKGVIKEFIAFKIRFINNNNKKIKAKHCRCKIEFKTEIITFLNESITVKDLYLRKKYAFFHWL